MRKEKVKIVIPKDDPVPTEVIAQSIIEISNAMERLSNTQLRREALVVLIHDRSKISKSVINIVLNNLESLKKTWLK